MIPLIFPHVPLAIRIAILRFSLACGEIPVFFLVSQIGAQTLKMSFPIVSARTLEAGNRRNSPPGAFPAG